MIPNIKIYCITFITILLIDAIWIRYIMTPYFKKWLGTLLRPSEKFSTPHVASILGVYLIMAFGFQLYVIPHLEPHNTLIQNFLPGALFGFVGYGIYELTNFAILVGWPLQMVISDIAWGITACGISGCIVAFIA